MPDIMMERLCEKQGGALNGGVRIGSVLLSNKLPQI